MRKKIFGRRFKRDSHSRKALFQGLMRSMVIHGRIETTEAKAKSMKGKLEKLVTKAIKHGETAKTELIRYFEADLVNALITQIAPKFQGRPGGYTRIIRLGNRKKDDAPMVLLEWVEQITVVLENPNEKRSRLKDDQPLAKKQEKKSEAKVTTQKVSKSKTEKKELSQPTKTKTSKKEKKEVK